MRLNSLWGKTNLTFERVETEMKEESEQGVVPLTGSISNIFQAHAVQFSSRAAGSMRALFSHRPKVRDAERRLPGMLL